MNQLGLPISLNASMLLESFVANKELLRLINQLF
ncbi:MAG: DnaA regulatory inactivator Hda, partial [Thiotrichales bacterium]|nr:DnaA regulatory inactivator Hda [Thiotrichales bacterium]